MVARPPLFSGGELVFILLADFCREPSRLNFQKKFEDGEQEGFGSSKVRGFNLRGERWRRRQCGGSSQRGDPCGDEDRSLGRGAGAAQRHKPVPQQFVSAVVESPLGAGSTTSRPIEIWAQFLRPVGRSGRSGASGERKHLLPCS